VSKNPEGFGRNVLPKRPRGRTRRPDQDQDWEDAHWFDQVEDVPGERFDLEHEIRQMGISATSGAMANRRT
jgi:hypothetical protein